MKIIYRQSGGIANLMQSATVDIEELSAKEAARWKTLVEASELKDLASTKSKASRDAIVYTITVEEEGCSSYTKTFDDTALTPELDELVAELAERSKPSRK